ncbi:sulfatase-like hydrolase/transferase [Variovorax saccharolyticus]|uniref:sulfatase-like hydrolase/transferase n=1 Tax=Variovorax saccharolyticus TaxID=3053516 RepID=UPI002575A98A|nr:sulfatase-like hydrolase/transferase [Variovorax sp. J22R187]MDM0020891.1 sulfatase-like hydrolase/transferase [Variovorax sp. J22R187]
MNTQLPPQEFDAGRRDLLKRVGAGTLAAGLGSAATAREAAPSSTSPSAAPAKRGAQRGGPCNILFILSDQERFMRPGELPSGYRLPGHERLARSGTVFENHRINSCVCTPSRSVLYTGQHIQHTKMFDNTNFPWIQSMSTDLPTVGDLLRKAGYYTAYKGKWHLTKEFETVNELGSPTRIFTQEMEAYGFSDYMGVGDIIAHDQGGYLHDGITAAMGVSWLRGRGMDLAAEGKPWFLAVNLVNPHDVMFLNTDRPGEVSQAKNMLGTLEPEPSHPLYARQWAFELPPSYSQPLTGHGRPPAHADYLRSHDGLVGHIANEDWRWRRRHNYYLNCLRDVDRHIVSLLDELDALGLASNTIVVLTADHGDLDGAHRLHGKGATAYREQNHVPLIVAHPAHPGGRRCRAVTSHLDIAPTLVGLTGADAGKKAAITQGLPGKDFSWLLDAPGKAGHDAVRDGALYCYNMFAYIDGDFMAQAVAMMLQPDGKAKVQAAAKDGSLRPDMRKRGAIRGVFDGRYQFTRYFSPKQHNRPTSIETLFGLNDVELYDLARDPQELNNLALDRERHAALLMAMNDKLNRLIDAEVGQDIGQMLPGGVDAGWVATDAVKDV